MSRVSRISRVSRFSYLGFWNLSRVSRFLSRNFAIYGLSCLSRISRVSRCLSRPRSGYQIQIIRQIPFLSLGKSIHLIDINKSIIPRTTRQRQPPSLWIERFKISSIQLSLFFFVISAQDMAITISNTSFQQICCDLLTSCFGKHRKTSLGIRCNYIVIALRLLVFGTVITSAILHT